MYKKSLVICATKLTEGVLLKMLKFIEVMGNIFFSLNNSFTQKIKS